MPNRLRRMCVSVILGLLAGCDSQDPPPAVALARHHLQHDDPQLALDSLAGLTPSADIHYLRGVALMQLDKLAAANEEFDAALEMSDQPRIRACRLKLRLFARDLSAAEKLIELELEHPADPVVRLACVYAYEARAVRLAAENKHEAAAAHRRRAGPCRLSTGRRRRRRTPPPGRCPRGGQVGAAVSRDRPVRPARE